jgi:IS5 family transposase
MIVTVAAQKPLPLGGLAGDAVHIFDRELAIIDELLADDELLEVMHAAVRRNVPRASRGAARMALNRNLRSLALKHIKEWSFPELCAELQRNLDYRAFTQFFDEPIPSVASFSRNFAVIDGEALRALNRRVIEKAAAASVVTGKMMRTDTTVCESNIHHPTDSGLMRDGVRVLHRLVKQAKQHVPALNDMRDRSRAALHHVLEINQAVRKKGPEGESKLQHVYRSFMRITRAVVTEAKKVVAQVRENSTTRSPEEQASAPSEAPHKRLPPLNVVQEKLESMTSRVDNVIRQTRARICRGDTQYGAKILSVFQPDVCAIRKGKAHKPTEFGRLVELCEIERGFVSDYKVHDGNPSDATLLIPALERHKEIFGRAPKKLATDRGFWSAENERAAKALGVKQVSIPFRGKISQARRRLQRHRWFRRLQHWRANGEGRIGTLKNKYGLDRCRYEGDAGMQRWVGGCVFANNLVSFARAKKAEEGDRDAKRDQEKTTGARKAA